MTSLLARLPETAAADEVLSDHLSVPEPFSVWSRRYVSALRGIVNPLLDRRLGSHEDPTSITREIESAADERGAAAVDSARR